MIKDNGVVNFINAQSDTTSMDCIVNPTCRHCRERVELTGFNLCRINGTIIPHWELDDYTCKFWK